jgi:hypothetical protein
MITQFGIFSGFYDVAEKNHCRVKHPNYDVYFLFQELFSTTWNPLSGLQQLIWVSNRGFLYVLVYYKSLGPRLR